MDNQPITQQQSTQPSIPTVQQAAAGVVNPVPNVKDNTDTVKTVIIVILSLMSATFIGLFIWMFLNYTEAKTDLDSKISVAVAEAKDEQAKKDEDEFAEREKDPRTNFSGPVDYGELSFKYPKTWSVYVEKDASNGGDFVAYFNPGGVNPIGTNTVNALRVAIRNASYDSVVSEYKRSLDKKGSDLALTVIKVGGVDANCYYGTIPGSELKGYIVIFKIRDKTAVIQTDSYLFKEDFDALLETITFNA